MLVEPRPSSLAADALCPARPRMQSAVLAAFGEGEDAAVATLGSRCDAVTCAAVVLASVGNLTGAVETIEAAQDLSSFDRWLCRMAMDETLRLINQHGITPDNVLPQHYLDMTDLDMPNGGTADMILVDPGRLVIVIDYKAGWLDQGTAETHAQLAAYGYAAHQTFRTQEVQVYLCQPRQDRDRRMTGARFRRDAVENVAAWTKAVVRRTRVENPEVVPGYNQCLRCKALTRCKAARTWFMNLKECLDAVGSPDDIDGWDNLMDAAKIATEFGDRGKEEGRAHLQAGGIMKRWKLGNGRKIQHYTGDWRASTISTARGSGRSSVMP